MRSPGGTTVPKSVRKGPPMLMNVGSCVKYGPNAVMATSSRLASDDAARVGPATRPARADGVQHHFVAVLGPRPGPRLAPPAELQTVVDVGLEDVVGGRVGPV